MNTSTQTIDYTNTWPEELKRYAREYRESKQKNRTGKFCTPKSRMSVNEKDKSKDLFDEKELELSWFALGRGFDFM